MEINQNDLDELSFDWSTNGVTSGNNSNIFGGTAGSGLERLASDFNGAISANNVVTSGLRSGTGAITNTALSGIVGNSGRLSDSNSAGVAPGVLSFLDNDFINGSQL